MKTQTETAHRLSESKQIAAEILSQLGGNRFIAMTGAKNFTYSEQKPGEITFSIMRNNIAAKWVRITLNSMDLYDMEFIKLAKGFPVVIEKHTGLYNDMLRHTFTQVTGLSTSLGTMGIY